MSVCACVSLCLCVCVCVCVCLCVCVYVCVYVLFVCPCLSLSLSRSLFRPFLCVRQPQPHTFLSFRHSCIFPVVLVCSIASVYLCRARTGAHPESCFALRLSRNRPSTRCFRRSLAAGWSCIRKLDGHWDLLSGWWWCSPVCTLRALHTCEPAYHWLLLLLCACVCVRVPNWCLAGCLCARSTLRTI